MRLRQDFIVPGRGLFDVFELKNISFNQALGALDIVGRSRVLKGFKLQPVVLIPLAGAAV